MADESVDASIVKTQHSLLNWRTLVAWGAPLWLLFSSVISSWLFKTTPESFCPPVNPGGHEFACGLQNEYFLPWLWDWIDRVVPLALLGTGLVLAIRGRLNWFGAAGVVVSLVLLCVILWVGFTMVGDDAP